MVPVMREQSALSQLPVTMRLTDRRRRRLGLTGALAVAVVLASMPAARAAGASAWQMVAPLNQGRTLSAAAVLKDGRILVAGGQSETFTGSGDFSQHSTNSAEIFDPASGRWQQTSGMSTYRRKLSLITLADGRALAIGGATSAKVFGASLALNTPCPTAGCTGPTAQVAQWHLRSAELYDPAAGTWAPAGNMAVARIWPTATLLGDGTVLVTGGGVSTAERYDPVTTTWRAAGDTGVARLRDTATSLRDGRVLDCGGYGTNGQPLSSCATYDPTSNTWHAAAAIPVPVADQAAARLRDGRVVIAGGQTGADDHATAATQLWDPVDGRWRQLSSLGVPRASAAVATLADGSVLVCGGLDGAADAVADCDGLAPTSLRWSSAPPLRQARFDFMMPTTVRGLHEEVLAIGGSVGWDAVLPGPLNDVKPTAATESYEPYVPPNRLHQKRWS